jgi:hypothetical protein
MVVKIHTQPSTKYDQKEAYIHSSFFVYTLTEEKMATANLTSRK